VIFSTMISGGLYSISAHPFKFVRVISSFISLIAFISSFLSFIDLISLGLSEQRSNAHCFYRHR